MKPRLWVLLCLSLVSRESHADPCNGNWAAPLSDHNIQLTVHSCGDVATAQYDMAQVMTIAREWVPKETALMGKPVLDDGQKGRLGNPDRNIDVYLFDKDANLEGFRGLSSTDKDGNPAPIEFAYEQSLGKGKSSGVILIDRKMVNQQNFLKRAFIHEYFHILQDARNAGCEGPGTWIYEASARAADIHFAPQYTTRYVASKAPVMAIGKDFGDFQNRKKKGLIEGETPGYERFIWFYYLIQRQRSGDVLRKLWQQLETTPCSEWNDALDYVAPFKTLFKDFAMRNLNLQELGAAIQPLYNELPGSPEFPIGITPIKPEVLKEDYLPTPQSGKPGESEELLKIPKTAARYFHYMKLDPEQDRKIRHVEFDFSKFKGFDSKNGFDYLAHVDRKWVRGSKVASNGKLTLCRDQKDENFDDLYLIISNYDHENDQQGVMTVRTKAICPSSSSGKADVHLISDGETGDAGNNVSQVSHTDHSLSLNLQMHMRDETENSKIQDPVDEWVDDGSTWEAKGTGSTTLKAKDSEEMPFCVPLGFTYQFSGKGSFDKGENLTPGRNNILKFVVDPDEPGTAWLHISISGPMSGTQRDNCGKSHPFNEDGITIGLYPCEFQTGTAQLGETKTTVTGSGKSPPTTKPTAGVAPAYRAWVRGTISDADKDGVRTATFACKGAALPGDFRNAHGWGRVRASQDINATVTVRRQSKGN